MSTSAVSYAIYAVIAASWVAWGVFTQVERPATPPSGHRATHDPPSAHAVGGVGKLGVRGLASGRPWPRRVQVVVNHPSRRGFDPRPLRFEQGMLALVLLIGFTFQAELLIPIVTAVLAVSGAVGPRRAPLPRLFSAVAGDRLEPPDAFVDRQTVRLSVLVQTSALAVASALVFIDLGFLAWIIALAVVATAAYDAATGSWIEAGLYWRIARRRRP
jgi:hypothetical protein